MPETINHEDSPEKVPASVPPLPEWEHDRLIKVEVKTETLSEGFIEIKKEVSDNTNEIAHLRIAIDSLRENMDDKFDSMQKIMDVKFGFLTKSFDKQSQEFSSIKKWVIGFVSACAAGLIVLLVKSGFSL